jgi:hypothetical protein
MLSCDVTQERRERDAVPRSRGRLGDASLEEHFSFPDMKHLAQGDCDRLIVRGARNDLARGVAVALHDVTMARPSPRHAPRAQP